MPIPSPTPAPRADASATLLRQLEQALIRARADAEAAREDKARFLIAINHEFRTPMNGVLAAAELMRRQPLSPDAAALLDVIAESANGLQRLLEDALDMARDPGAELAVAPEPLSPAALLDAAEARWRPLAQDAGVKLAAAFDGHPDLFVSADPTRLAQVLDAFAEQALARQSGRGGLIEIRLRARAEAEGVMLRLSIRDAGPPLAATQVARLFEPFAIDDGRGCEGRGLRLALARRVAEACHGRVWAEPGADGGLLLGMDACLPRAQAPAAAPANALSDTGRTPRVLIVDDNATNRLVATAFCEGAGCLCETAEDGAQAVEAVRSRPFDVVLMDIKMPVLDGVAATRAIRALPGAMRDTPIIALTANVDVDLARAYRAAGMCDVVDKPIKPEKLFAALNLAMAATVAETRVADAA